MYAIRSYYVITFKLVDVREHMEWQMGHIRGADQLIPTSSFFDTLDKAKLSKDETIILYCHVGSRSSHCQRILQEILCNPAANQIVDCKNELV